MAAIREAVREEINVASNGHKRERLLTAEELAEKLRLPVSWVYELRCLDFSYGNFAGKLANVRIKVQFPIPYANHSKVRLIHPDSICSGGHNSC